MAAGSLLKAKVPVEAVHAPQLKAGLTNMGGTCYINSLLQIWFSNRLLRAGIYKSTSKGILRELRRLFAQMQALDVKRISPVTLIDSLQIDHHIQQDSQEFCKLLTACVEQECRIANDSVRNLMQDIYRGEYRYATTCQTCHRPSYSPGIFYELEIRITVLHT